MQTLSFALIAKHIPLSIIFCLPPIFVILKYKKLQFAKLSFALLVIICGAMTEILLVLHEAGHILVAKLYNIETINFSCNLVGYFITLNPPICEVDGFLQMTIAIAGPAVSSVTALLMLLIIQIFKNRFIKIVSTYLFYVSMMGGVFSLFLPFSGDARNFFQGLAKFLVIDLVPLAFLNVVLSITIIALTGIKIYRIIDEL